MSVAREDRATFETSVTRDVRIPTADPHVTLAADLFLPIVDGPVPLVLMALPYRKDMGGADMLLGYFARHGYAGMVVDLRGTGTSDGVPRPPFSPSEGQDAIDAITWATAQPWCTGRVGMFGHSYGAWTAMCTAAMKPEGLDAIIPIQGPIDPERDLMHPNQARGGWTPLTWLAGMLGLFLVPPLAPTDEDAATARWLARLDHLAPYLTDPFALAPGDARWRERALDASQIETPALCIAGWRDLFADAQIRAYESMTGPKRLIAGPWMHVLPVAAAEGSFDFLGTCLDWWDTWLADVDNGAAHAPSAAFVQGAEPRWLAFDAWPTERVRCSPDAQPAGLGLQADHRPDRTDPTVGVLSGLTRLSFAGIGRPMDQHSDDMRCSSWTSGVLTEPRLLLGRAEVRLADLTSDRVVVRLTHVDPAGRSTFITSGAMGEGGRVAAPFAGSTATIVLDAASYEVPAGHRIRLTVSDADYPRLWPAAPAAAGTTLVEAVLPVLPAEHQLAFDLPGEPAYLRAMLASLAGTGPQFRFTREMGTDALDLAFEPPPADQELPDGGRLHAESRTTSSVDMSGRCSLQVRSAWTLGGPEHDDLDIRLELDATDERVEMLAHLSRGSWQLQRSWTAPRPSGPAPAPAAPEPETR